MLTYPHLSIVIPTHNRRAALERTLLALAVQAYPMENVQVIVVADACSDNTAESVRRMLAPYSLQVVETQARSAAAARNVGAEIALADLILFLDDDVEPARELVAAHVSAHMRRRGLVVLGPYPPVIERNPSFFRMELARWWQDHFYALHLPDHRITYRDICTGNLSLESRAYMQLGGMDPAFQNAGGEDYEFGIRVIEAGLTVQFVPRALAHHHDSSGLDRILQRVRQEGRSDVLIGRRHPAMRSHLPLGLSAFHPLANALCNFAFRFAPLGDPLAALMRESLNLFQRAHLRVAWYKAFQLLHAYGYWRGVADELGSMQALSAYLHDDSSAADPLVEIEIDLSLGLLAAEHRLDQERPFGMQLDVGRLAIGRVPASPGIEPLRGAHLRGILARDFAWPLLQALAIDSAVGQPSALSDEIIGTAVAI